MTPLKILTALLGLLLLGGGAFGMRQCYLLIDRGPAVAPRRTLDFIRRLTAARGADPGEESAVRHTALFALPVCGVSVLIGFGAFALTILAAVSKNP